MRKFGGKIVVLLILRQEEVVEASPSYLSGVLPQAHPLSADLTLKILASKYAKE